MPSVLDIISGSVHPRAPEEAVRDVCAYLQYLISIQEVGSKTPTEVTVNVAFNTSGLLARFIALPISKQRENIETIVNFVTEPGQRLRLRYGSDTTQAGTVVRLASDEEDVVNLLVTN